jgi:hypothetical protein
VSLVCLAFLTLGLAGAHSAPLEVESLWAEAGTPAAPTPLSPDTSPLAAPISFGNSFETISRVCLHFHFTGDLLDAGEELSTSWGVGFGHAGPPANLRSLCVPTSSDPATASRLLDGADDLTVSMTNGSVTVGAVVATVDGDSVDPVSYRIASDETSYTVAQGDSIPVSTTLTADPDSDPPVVELTWRNLVPDSTFATEPASGTPTFASGGELAVSETAEPGNYQLVVTGEGGGFTRSYDVNVTVTAVAEIQTYTVNSNGDPGDGVCDGETCTLREAMDAANGDLVPSRIRFDLGGFATIGLDSLLPELTAPVHIDGTNLGGGGPVAIDASGVGSGGQALQLGSGSDGSEIENLDIFGLDLIGGVGIRVLSSNNTISANDIFDTEDGIVVQDGAANNTIGVEEVEGSEGGQAVGEGNRIWDFGSTGVLLAEAGSGNQVAGNTIGLDSTGEPDGGVNGIVVDTTPGAVIGASAGSDDLFILDLDLGNVIVDSEFNDLGTGGHGIRLVDDTTGAIVAANFVGTDRSGRADLGNANTGIDILDAANNQLGPGNTVTDNGFSETGIHIESGNGNRIVANSIYDNVGKGIALVEGNNGRAEPQLFSAALEDGTTDIVGSVSGAPGRMYYLELFSNPACDATESGEGKTYLDFREVIPASETDDFTVEVGGLSAGQVVTATLTDSVTNDTSEFSNCATVGGGSGGTLSGSLGTTGGDFDLTSLGTDDWAVWGYASEGTSTSLAPDVSKAGGTAISTLTNVDAAPTTPLRGIGRFATALPYTFDWSNGTEPGTANDARAGLQHNAEGTGGSSLGDGFTFSVPADTTTRTLRVYTTAHWATGTLTATLSDDSAEPYVATHTGPRGVPAPDNVPGVFTITYAAASSEQQLTVEWVETAEDCAEFRCDNVAISAVALEGPGVGGVDLMVDSIALSAPAPFPQPHSYTVTVRNAGTVAADISDVTVQGAYSADTLLDGSDSPACGRVTGVATLAPGATTQVIVGCSAAPGAGHNYLLAKVDAGGVLAETDESNNVGVVSLDASTVDPPVLFAAVPNANGPVLGVAGLVEHDGVPAGTELEVSFFSSASCDDSEPSQIGEPRTVATNANGVAAFALEMTVNVPEGTAVTAVARLGDSQPSGASNCVIADRNNTSWPTALALPANGGDTGFLRSSGQARWFKVPILANSRVDVRLSGLPADYDMVVFSDIQAAYERMVGGADYDEEAGPNLALDDLARQGAETPTDVFNTSQYNPSTWDAENWDPTLNTAGFSPSEWSPSEWSPSEWSASHFSPSEWSPSEWSPSEWSPSEWSPSEWSPSEWSPSQWAPSEWSSSNPADPRAFSVAQTASVVAVAGGTGTGDETISVNTWNNTGFFYIRVQGKNGAFVPDDDFALSVARQGNLCEGVVDQPSSPGAPPGDRKTVILVDGARMTVGGSLSTKLQTFAARPEVAGAIVDVNADTTVRALNAQADAKKACPYAKNLVASAITRIVDAYRAENPIEYVVVVGDDSVIPFYRYPDPALLGNETMYVPPVRDDTASQASLRLGYVLNQDGYGSSESIALHGNLFPVPDLAIGRLVETPAEIEGMLDAYLGTSAGVVATPTSSLVTGYDFLQDAADTIAGHLSTGVGGSNNDTLITDRTVSPATITVGTTPDRNHSWTAVDLRRALFASGRHDLIFLAGHFSANDALAADYQTNVLSTELPLTTTNFENTIVFSAGCHAGYNIVNGDATFVTEPIDWAQAFAKKKATLISGTGYQYGDTDFLAHSERIYAEFARQLRVTSDAGGAPEPVAVGDALLRSKQIFLETTPGLTSLDEKALLQATLFGLPMLSINLPQGRIVEAPDATEIGSLSGVAGGPGSELGLQFADRGVGAALTSASVQLTDGPLATYLSGADGVAVRPTQPILPLESLNVTSPDPDFVLRGVGFRGGSYTDTNGVTPLTAAPATELRGVHAPFFTDVLFPTQPWTANFFDAVGSADGTTRLHVTPVQHRSTSATATRREFSNLDLRLFYSGNVSSYCPGTNPRLVAPCPGGVAVAPALAAPPTITGIDTSFDDDTDELTFEARVVGDVVAGIQSVWVTWTIPPGAGQTGGWQSLDLEVDPDDPALWTGTLSLAGGADPGLVNFVVQAVNGVGRVTIDDNVGAYYRPGSIPGGAVVPGAPARVATAMTFINAPPDTVTFGQSFEVTVELTAGGTPVSGKPVRVGFGDGLPAVTNENGRATVTLRAALSPGTYPVAASFAGDTTHAASDVSDAVQVNARPTQLSLSGTLGTRTLGNSLSVTATLQASSPTAALHQRTVFVVFKGTGPANTGVLEVFAGKTDPLGRVDVPGSLLSSLPVGGYDVDAYFNGVSVAGLQLPADDVDYAPSTAHATLNLLWPFAGFFAPVNNPPTVNVATAGSAAPVKFSLGGNRGLDIFQTGYPKVIAASCTTGAPTDAIEETVTAGSSSLQYDAAAERYTYIWKTQTSFAKSCRKLVLRLIDGSEREALFKFR